MRVLVVGGGIGGLSLAAALTRRHVDCDLVEREPVWTTVGAGITLYPNGIRAFGHLGLAERVVAAGVPVELVRTMDARGRVIAESPGERWEGVECTLAIHRAALQRILLDAARHVPIRMGTTDVAIADNGGEVVVAFSDGTTDCYDVVVGADGIRSSVRAQCFVDTPPRYVGQMYWRTSIPATVVDTATLQFADNRFVAIMPMATDLTYVALQLHCEHAFNEPAAGLVHRARRRFADFQGPAAAA